MYIHTNIYVCKTPLDKMLFNSSPPTKTADNTSSIPSISTSLDKDSTFSTTIFRGNAASTAAASTAITANPRCQTYTHKRPTNPQKSPTYAQKSPKNSKEPDIQ